MVVGEKLLGQKGWNKTKRLLSNKENQGCTNHDLTKHGNDAKLKSVHVMPTRVSKYGMTLPVC